MKHIPFILILIFLTSCSKDPSPVVFSYKPKDVIIKDTVLIKDSIEQCVFDDFFVKAIVNDKCWVTNLSEIRLYEGKYVLYSILDSSFIRHSLTIRIGMDLVLGERIRFKNWFSLSEKRFISYEYLDLDAPMAWYWHPVDPDSISNYLIVDKINSDTTIIEGRFKAAIPRIRDNINLKLKDTLYVKDGSFRSKVLKVK